MSDPYFTQTVVSTRPTGANDAFETRLKEHGINTLHMPMIEIRPPEDWAPVDEAIEALEVYSGLVFTSANAVTMFMERMKVNGRTAQELPPVHAVGEKTAAALIPYGIEPASVPDAGGAAELVASLGGVDNQYFLHPTSDKARKEFSGIVAEMGGRVNAVTAYRTVTPEYKDVRELDEQLIMGEIDCVAFFSPSAVENFKQVIPEFKQATVLVAVIGATTAGAASANGLRVDIVAEGQTSESLADAIAARFASNESIEFDDGELIDVT